MRSDLRRQEQEGARQLLRLILRFVHRRAVAMMSAPNQSRPLQAAVDEERDMSDLVAGQVRTGDGQAPNLQGQQRTRGGARARRDQLEQLVADLTRGEDGRQRLRCG